MYQSTRPKIGTFIGLERAGGLMRSERRRSQMTNTSRMNARFVLPNTVPFGYGSRNTSTLMAATMLRRHATPNTSSAATTGMTRWFGVQYWMPRRTPEHGRGHQRAPVPAAVSEGHRVRQHEPRVHPARVRHLAPAPLAAHEPARALEPDERPNLRPRALVHPVLLQRAHRGGARARHRELRALRVVHPALLPDYQQHPHAGGPPAPAHGADGHRARRVPDRGLGAPLSRPGADPGPARFHRHVGQRLQHAQRPRRRELSRLRTAVRVLRNHAAPHLVPVPPRAFPDPPRAARPVRDP